MSYHWCSISTRKILCSKCIGFLMEMLHHIKWNYQISIDVAIMLTGYTMLLNIQWRSYRIYYHARDRFVKNVIARRRPIWPAWKNIPNKFRTQLLRRRCKKRRKKRAIRKGIKGKPPADTSSGQVTWTKMEKENQTKRTRKFLRAYVTDRTASEL